MEISVKYHSRIKDELFSFNKNGFKIKEEYVSYTDKLRLNLFLFFEYLN